MNEGKNPPIGCSSVNVTARNVKAIIDSQQAKGFNKYGKTVDDANLNAIEWILHTQEELADSMIYLEALKKEWRSERITAIAKLETKQLAEIEINLMNEIKSRLENLIIKNSSSEEGLLVAIYEIDEMIDETTL